MNDRTASAVKRLLHSSDFLTFTESLKDDLEIQIKILVTTKEDILLRRAQGTSQYLQSLIRDIEVSMK